MSDQIVEEIHAIRRKTCEECDFDLKELGKYYMRLQDEDPANLIVEVPTTEAESANNAGA
jgi:hypothetical protein